MRAKLIPLDDGPAIELAKDLTLIGRNEDCDIRIDHKSVSKLHCLLVKTDGLVLVRDLGSTNGTRVNGQRVRRAALLPNDHLAIAAYRYQVRFGEGMDEPLPAAPAGPDPASMPEDQQPNERDAETDPRGPLFRRNALPDVIPDASSRS
jgi:pSer/pThr/pTyr-binding forkhead associated (FHA) protein